MENIKIAVITPDRDYGRALGLALVDVYKNFYGDFVSKRTGT